VAIVDGKAGKDGKGTMGNENKYSGMEKIEHTIKEKGENSMKVKRAILAIVIVGGLLGIFAPAAGAAPAWFYCTVNDIGLGFGSGYVNLTDSASPPAFSHVWFTLSPDYRKEFLAMVLTAQSNGSTVLVYVDPATEYYVINALYVQPVK